MRKLPIGAKVVLKGFAVFLMVTTLFAMASITIEEATEGFIDDNDMSRKISWCDTDYYEKEYYELWDTLELFELNSKEFDIYWESVEGHKDYMQYSQWVKAQEARESGSDKMVRYYEDKMKQNLEDCRFEKNREQLEGYLTLLENGTEN